MAYEGSFTGLSDSNGRPIHIGHLLKVEVTANVAFHGSWSYYRVECRGMVPTMSYLKSDKEPGLPTGYLSGLLSDHYDTKMIVFGEGRTITPQTKLYVIEEPA